MTKAVWRATFAGTLVGLLAAGGLAVGVSPASAHVTANGEASPGSFARIDFRVPNESDTESTVAVEVHFPEDAPVPSVSVGQVPGWSSEITRRTLDEPIEGGHGETISEVVEVVTWTLEDPDAAIGPGQFQEFPVSMGPMPEVDAMFFPALQTYSDENIVRWIELPEGDAEPDFPAPSVQLTSGGAGDEPVDEPASGDTAGDEQVAAGDDDSGSSTGGIVLGIVALVAGLAGLALGGLAFQRTRS